MTKEMTAGHRIDVLTEAFVYYGFRKKQVIGTVSSAQILNITNTCLNYVTYLFYNVSKN